MRSNAWSPEAMTRDEQAVVALLRSLYDWVPGPRAPAGSATWTPLPR